jgi:hypothetical protein
MYVNRIQDKNYISSQEMHKKPLTKIQHPFKSPEETRNRMFTPQDNKGYI